MSLFQKFFNAGSTGINTVKQLICIILGAGGILTMCAGLPASKGHWGTDWTHSASVAPFFVVGGIIISAVFIIYLIIIRIYSNKKQ